MAQNATPIRGALTQIDQLLTQLAQLLAKEKDLLINRVAPESETESTAQTQEGDVPSIPDQLEMVASEKSVVCEVLSTFQLEAVKQEIEALDDEQDRQELELVHTSTLEHARAVRDSNLVNGKILAKSQHVTREILNILGGKSFEGLYGQSGHPTSDADRGGAAIAKA